VKLRARLLLVTGALILVFVVLTDAVLSKVLDGYMTRSVRDDLSVRVALVAAEAAAERHAADDRAFWEGFARERGARAGAHVSIIRADGALVGDSAVPPDGPGELDGGADRPEVRAALANGVGDAVRESAALHQRVLYAAQRVDGLGVVRAALPLDSVDRAIVTARGLLIAASALALVIATLVTLLTTRRVTRIVRSLTAAAARMADGDLGARTRLAGGDELGVLGRTLDHLAAGLDTSLGELKRERDLAAGILAAMQEGLLVLDADGRIASVNPALREMLLLPADVVGKRPLEVIRHHELSELIARGSGSSELELSGVKPRRLLARVSRLGAPGGTLVVFFDVTELRRLESLRRDFVANVSHELRTPVAAVRSAAETLRGVSASGDAKATAKFLDIIERNAERLQDLVEDVLDLSRIESRQYHLRPEAIELTPALSQAVLALRGKAEKKGVSVRVDVPGSVPAARADRRALDQVVGNLVDNAIKYCGSGATVVVRGAATRAGELEVAVEDDGPGIEERHLPRLFERFYRVDPGRGRDSGGTGLGLSIVKHLVEAMGGKVTVTSTPGSGSTFRFTLPKAA
jgi:two-component system phosphate regulon sensor histidine kinase PhoR